MEIRKAQQEDLKELADMHSRAFSEADPEKPWPPERALKLLEHFYKHQPDIFFAAEEKGKLVGAMMAMIKPWRRGNRCTEAVLFVHPEFHKSGIGKKLFIRLLEEAIGKYQADSFEAVTFAAKEFPLTWYEKIGLEPDQSAVLIKGQSKVMLERLRQ